MRPFRFFFGLLFVAALAFVLLKVLFFAAFGALVFGALFFGARAFRRMGPGRYRHEWQMAYAVPDYARAEPLDPRQARPSAEPLGGGRTIEVL